jgi:zinc protease
VIAIRPALSALSMLLAAFLCAAAPAARAVEAPPFPHEKSEFKPDPAVRYGKLPNGLRYCLMVNQQPKDKVVLRLQVENGSLVESDAQRGCAHFLEHMAFNGSAHFPPGKLVELLQGMGLAFGAHTNAHTSFDETVYKLDLPDPQPKTLGVGLQVIADWAGALLIQQPEVDKERGVILAEMRDRNTPGFREFLALAKTRYPGLIIGDRAPIGVSETIEKADAKQLRAYYDDWYRPDMMILAVVGMIDLDQAEAEVRARFGELTQRAPARPRPPLGSLKIGVDVLCHHESEDDSTSATVELVRPRPRPHDSVAVRRLSLLQELGERVFNRRLSDLVEADPQGPLLSGSMESEQWLDFFIASCDAQARPGRALEALKALEIERRRLLAYGPTADELAVAARVLKAALDQAVEQKASRTDAALATSLYSAAHRDEVFLTPEQARDLLGPMIDAARPEDVLAALKDEWMPEGGHTMAAIVGRDDLGGDGLARTRAAFDEAEAAPIARPEARKAAVWAYGAIADSGAVVADTVVSHQVRELRFANQAMANLKRTDFQPGQVLVALRLQVPAAERQPGIADLIGMAFTAGGLGRHPAQELRQIFAGSSLRLDGPRFEEDGAVFTASCLPKDLELCLQDLRAFIVDPGWREEAETRAKSAWIEALNALETDLDAQVSRAFTAAVVGNAPQRRPVALDEAKAVTFGQARRWFTPLLEKAPLELSIVGDIDLDQAASLAKHYIGSLGERRPAPVITDVRAPGVLAPGTPFPVDLRRLDVPGTNARAIVLIGWPTDDFYDIAQTRRLGLLAEAMTEKLRVKVREELGEAYSPHAWREASEAYRGSGWIAALVGVAPIRAEDARQAVLAIAQDLADHGIDEELLGRIKVPVVKNLAAHRQRNQYWLSSVLERAQEQPFRLDWAQSMEEDYGSITAADINELARRYLVNGHALQIIGVCRGEQGKTLPMLGPPAPAEAK